MISVRYLSAPVFVWWDVTYACNLRCRQCYSSSGKAHPNELSREEAMDIIKQLAEMKVFYIYFLGGEPLMRRDFFELAEYAHECGIAVMMNTNGWFITPTIADRLEKAGLMHVRVSIDGARARTHDAIRGVRGSFKRAIKAVKILRKTNIPRIGISPTVLADNVTEMAELIELAVKLEVDEMQLVQLCARGRGSSVQSASIAQLIELRKVFYEYKNKLAGKLNLTATEGILLDNTNKKYEINSLFPNFWGCPAGRTCLAIEAEGTIQPCILYNIPVGNIRKSSLKEIWHESPLFRKMRTPSEECLKCHYVEFCSGECPIDSCIDRLFRYQFIECSQKKEEKSHGER